MSEILTLEKKRASKATTPMEKLLESLSAASELKKSLSAIFLAWPNLKDATIKLLEYTMDVIPAEKGGLLIQSCLKSAVDDYQEASMNEFGTEAQMVRYLRGLLKHAPSVADVTIANRAEQVWEPFDQTLSQFAGSPEETAKLSVILKPYCVTNRDSLRMMLLSRVITIRDLQWIDEHITLGAFFEGAA